jgi:hypothetical protein
MTADKLEALERVVRDVAYAIINLHLLRSRELTNVANTLAAIRDEMGGVTEAIERVLRSTALLTMHGDGRAYFESGADARQFREAIAALTAALNPTTGEGNG